MAEKYEKYAEVALEPSLRIIDTHHHLWTDKPKAVQHAVFYSVDQLERDAAAGHDVVASIYVECQSALRTGGPEALRPVGETEWVAGLRVREGLLAGIVGHADLELGPKVGEVLDAHIEVAGNRFKGVRHSVSWDEDSTVYKTTRPTRPRMLLDPQFRKGTAELARRGLHFEAWALFHQLVELVDLARAQPDLSIVLCHMGGPIMMGPYLDRRDETLDAWRRAIVEVSGYGNIVIKLGGIGFPPFGGPDAINTEPSSIRIADYWQQEIDFCIKSFGPARCMFESNFPVDNVLCDYVTLWNAFKRMTRQYSADERESMFEMTARRVYRLC